MASQEHFWFRVCPYHVLMAPAAAPSYNPIHPSQHFHLLHISGNHIPLGISFPNCYLDKYV